MRNEKGQVWIETVLYTLMGLALIGVVLAFIMPKISETKDRLAIEQTSDSLNEIASKIDMIPGNVRLIDFTMKRGSLTLDSAEDNIVFVFDDITKPYSEIDQEITQGKITLKTEKGQKYYTVTLALNLTGQADLRYKGENVLHKFTASPTAYRFKITRKSADEPSEPQIVDFDEVS